MGTKNNPGKFDCYANADDNEPMFILLARDKHAPALVWLWATMRELDGEDMAKVVEARECTNAMIAWQKENDRPTCGLSMPAIAGMLELIRAANHSAKTDRAEGTSEQFIRLLLSHTKFE